ncbi:MAG TPA: S46 family peptidase [Steroidobacteraceae bacterium]|nr:S46 family peptidase [Steroidobacteraceae bacterium]
MTRLACAAVAALMACLCSVSHADEGMWTFHGFPFAKANAALKTNLDQAWLDRVRSATVRLSNCTATFVSNEGMILTNHHCIAACLAEQSSKEKSYLEDGFLAKTRDEEKRCQTQVADVLIGMEEITAKVAAATAGKDEATANDVRKSTLTQLEGECEAQATQKCQTVTLYEGGQYWLYKYKRYTDVRLVFAPEASIAAFGGDPDNFQFPRWCLDMGLLRAYENGKPAMPSTFLKVNFAGPAAGDPVFVSGHPGSTDRLLTLAQLKQQRNLDLPQWLLRYSEIRGRLIQFTAVSPQNERIAADLLSGIENGIKVRRKMLDALHEDTLLDRKAADQAALQKSVAKNAALKKSTGDPWSDVDAALRAERAIYVPHNFVENGAGFQGRLVTYARTLVRGAAERDKPNGQRFREFTDGVLPRIEQQLGASVPVYPELEELRLGNSLERMREWLGPDHPVVRKLMSKESPVELAKRLVTGTKLADPAVRLELWKGGSAAIAASKDPMIELARSIDPDARALRKTFEDGVEAPLRSATERIARARFASLGTSVYPDATFTLRLNYGTVQGWTENGMPIEPLTRLARVFERATGSEPFRVPDSWQRVKDKLDMTTPFNVSTNSDIVGGNSGSPLINAKGEIVGLLFDGNIHSISGAYWFDTEKNRAIAVHPAIMREALSKVYSADAVLAELTR